MNKCPKEDMKERYELIMSLTGELDKKLKELPEGKLYIKHHKYGDYYYRVVEGHGEEYLCRADNQIVENLIQKGYLEKVLKASMQELKALESALDKYPETVAEDVYEKLSEGRKKIAKPIRLTDEQFIRKWLDTPYVHKPVPEDSQFVTKNGEHVRSKSEVIIADRLLANGIPYKYECPIVVNKKTIHPDFTMLKISNRKILYLEHCGKMDDPSYTEDYVVKRVNDYSRAGIIQGDNLFLTFESSTTPLDIRVLDKMIKECFK